MPETLISLPFDSPQRIKPTHTPKGSCLLQEEASWWDQTCSCSAASHGSDARRGAVHAPSISKPIRDPALALSTGFPSGLPYFGDGTGQLKPGLVPDEHSALNAARGTSPPSLAVLFSPCTLAGFLLPLYHISWFWELPSRAFLQACFWTSTGSCNYTIYTLRKGLDYNSPDWAQGILHGYPEIFSYSLCCRLTPAPWGSRWSEWCISQAGGLRPEVSMCVSVVPNCWGEGQRGLRPQTVISTAQLEEKYFLQWEHFATSLLQKKVTSLIEKGIVFFQFYSKSLKWVTNNLVYNRQHNSLIPTAWMTRPSLSGTVKYPAWATTKSCAWSFELMLCTQEK